jgi:cellulose synthase/poly-beta-1,6-N-acetylglucosamine synthase-like glycosyltransferase
VVIRFLFFTLSLILTLLFFLYGFNHYYLLNAARSYQTPSLPENSLFRPAVSVQLPLYNEKYVVQKLVSACAAMVWEYGIDKARILILDDSDDDTVTEVDQVVEEYKKKGFQIEVLRRGRRDGFKAGALQAALRRTDEEFIAIFDADFVPSVDFLLRTVPYFIQDKSLGIIQGRWTHLNRNYSLATQAIAHAIDVHFLIEQPGRYVTGCFQNFNGSGGVLRKKAILEAGGWQADTLAEDLDLSYHMQILGYRTLYLRDILCPGEIPPTIANFKQQQSRWACGAMRVARKILPGLILNRKFGWKLRVEAFIHLTGYVIQPLMVIAFVLSCLAALWRVNIYAVPQVSILIQAYGRFFVTKVASILFLQNLIWLFLTLLIALCTCAPWISLISTLRIQNLSLPRNLASLLVLLLLCFGISLSTMQGVAKGLFTNRSWEWTRTPKFADLQNKQAWRRSKYQIPLDPVWMWELAFTAVGLWAIGAAVQHLNFTDLIILVPFTLSYGFVFWFSILQSRREKIG